MRGLKIIYPLCGVFLLCLFHILHAGGKAAYLSIYIVLTLMAPLGYVYERPRQRIAVSALSLTLPPLFIFLYGRNMVSAAAPLLVFNGLLIGFARCKDVSRGIEAGWARALEERRASVTALSGELDGLIAEEGAIRARETAIVNLYEITKKMSASLKFDEIFAILSASLRENVMFRKAELIILKQPDEPPAADRVYTVWRQEAEGEKGGGIINYHELIRYMAKERNGISLARKNNAPLFEELGLREGVETFVSVPLMSEKKLVGILTVEEMPETDYERFTILATQLSLEIKKVLLYETVESLAITDSLTGLYVRRYFFERLGEELDRSRRYALTFAFLMVDIDDFKKMNDTYGHLVGDVILRDVARIIKQSVREIDFVARYGGEEFSLVLPETDASGARLVADRVRKRVAENVFRAYDEKLNVTISVGISVYPGDAPNMRNLVERADRALYEAKRSGKNVVCVYGK